MCNLTDNFYEDLFLDLQYQEYIYRKNLEKNQQYDEVFSIEQKAYDIQAEQYFKDLHQYEIAMLEKEYRTIEEWEKI
jgi:hypothetical protein